MRSFLVTVTSPVRPYATPSYVAATAPEDWTFIGYDEIHDRSATADASRRAGGGTTDRNQVIGA
ncbi:hypothetical protein N8E89_22780 (plasmid) [Phyllobacterium sp. A18/5-2]|nr:hypothetical protein [Phyllobacterium sp. A18/5-2]UXN66054.1 hypothetical protein N8E89_22780 [Phyllobacterium sp. A18/5-2]